VHTHDTAAAVVVVVAAAAVILHNFAVVHLRNFCIFATSFYTQTFALTYTRRNRNMNINTNTHTHTGRLKTGDGQWQKLRRGEQAAAAPKQPLLLSAQTTNSRNSQQLQLWN